MTKSEYQVWYRNNNRGKIRKYTRNWHIKRKYGLSMEDKENLLKKQKNNCAICEKPFSKKEKNYIDHCHKSGKVRGIVHGRCNILLGFSKENIETLKMVIQYIKKHQNKQ